jgi:hypothetical protein
MVVAEKLKLCGVREAVVAGSDCFQVPLASAAVVILCAPSIIVVTTVPAATKPQTTACLGLAPTSLGPWVVACRTMCDPRVEERKDLVGAASASRGAS